MNRHAPLYILLAAAIPAAAAGQVPDSAGEPPDSVVVADTLGPEDPIVVPVPDSVPDGPVTPRSAMFRSFLLPGWGQAEYDAHFRGTIYFAGFAANWFMNFRNAVRLSDARERLEIRRSQVETALIANSPNPDSMRAQIDSFPDVLETAVDEDELGGQLQGLVESRSQQREDWIAWSIFWLLASGIDAYVTGHLSDFPAAVEIEPNPDRSVELRIEVPLPRHRP